MLQSINTCIFLYTLILIIVSNNTNNHYCDPFQDKVNIKDLKLLKLLEMKQPEFIMINAGGGAQERLGSYLKNHLS